MIVIYTDIEPTKKKKQQQQLQRENCVQYQQAHNDNK